MFENRGTIRCTFVCFADAIFECYGNTCTHEKFIRLWDTQLKVLDGRTLAEWSGTVVRLKTEYDGILSRYPNFASLTHALWIKHRDLILDMATLLHFDGLNWDGKEDDAPDPQPEPGFDE